MLTIGIAPPTTVAPQQMPSEQFISVAAPPVATTPQLPTIECVGSVPNPVAEMPITPVSSMEDAFGRPSSISQVAVPEPTLSTDGSC